jgi:hypothetical protein
MIGFLTGVQKVELIGGESWLEHDSIAIAAISAAVLAALVAILNRRAQLDHDREMRNRDHVRDTIDEVVELTSEAVKATSLFHTQLRTVESKRKQQAMAEVDEETFSAGQEEELVSFEEELGTRANHLYEALVALHPVNVRLIMRLGETDAICETFETTRKAIEVFYVEGVPGLDGNRDSAQQDNQRKEEVRDSFSTFRYACYGWFKDKPKSGLWSRLRRP